MKARHASIHANKRIMRRLAAMLAIMSAVTLTLTPIAASHAESACTAWSKDATPCDTSIAQHTLDTEDVPGEWTGFQLDTLTYKPENVTFDSGWKDFPYKEGTNTYTQKAPTKKGATIGYPSVGTWTDTQGAKHTIDMTLTVIDANCGGMTLIYGEWTIIDLLWGHKNHPMGCDTSRRAGIELKATFALHDTGQAVPDTFKGVTGFTDLDTNEGVELLDGFHGEWQVKGASLTRYGSNGWQGASENSHQTDMSTADAQKHVVTATFGSTFAIRLSTSTLDNWGGGWGGWFCPPLLKSQIRHKVTWTDWAGREITSANVLDGQAADAPSLRATTLLADPQVNFDADKWGSWDAQGVTSTHRDITDGTRAWKTTGTVTMRAAGTLDCTQAGKDCAIGIRRIDTNGKDDWHTIATCAKGKSCTVDGITALDAGTLTPWLQIDCSNGTTSTSGACGTMHATGIQFTQVDATSRLGVARDGYTFTGWRQVSGSSSTGNVTDDIVMQAQYTPIVYMVAYDGNGGTGSMTASAVTYGRAASLTHNAFTRPGYMFAGWNTKKDGTGKAYTDGATVQDLLTHSGAYGTLYAQWTDIRVTTMPATGKTHRAAWWPWLFVALGLLLAVCGLARGTRRR